MQTVQLNYQDISALPDIRKIVSSLSEILGAISSLTQHATLPLSQCSNELISEVQAYVETHEVTIECIGLYDQQLAQWLGETADATQIKEIRELRLRLSILRNQAEGLAAYFHNQTVHNSTTVH